jgi:hypothetical protein
MAPQIPARALARLREQSDGAGDLRGAEIVILDLVSLERNGQVAIDGDSGRW